jgi:tetratricopeptide (TPR) repeat protein
MGSIRIRQRNFAGAISYLEEAQQMQPRNKVLTAALETARFRFYLDEGHHSLAANELTAAERRYLSALELRPDSYQAFLGLHSTLVKALRARQAALPIRPIVAAPQLAGPASVTPSPPIAAEAPPAAPQLVVESPVAVPTVVLEAPAAVPPATDPTPPVAPNQDAVYGPYVPYVQPWMLQQANGVVVTPPGQ